MGVILGMVGPVLREREGREGRMEVAEGVGSEGLETGVGLEDATGEETEGTVRRPIMSAADVCFNGAVGCMGQAVT